MANNVRSSETLNGVKVMINYRPQACASFCSHLLYRPKDRPTTPKPRGFNVRLERRHRQQIARSNQGRPTIEWQRKSERELAESWSKGEYRDDDEDNNALRSPGVGFIYEADEGVDSIIDAISSALDVACKSSERARERKMALFEVSQSILARRQASSFRGESVSCQNVETNGDLRFL